MKRKENDMEDRNIIELFFARDEKALSESQKKYGRYCETVSKNILGSEEDAEECLRVYNRGHQGLSGSFPEKA